MPAEQALGGQWFGAARSVSSTIPRRFDVPILRRDRAMSIQTPGDGRRTDSTFSTSPSISLVLTILGQRQGWLIAQRHAHVGQTAYSTPWARLTSVNGQ